MKHTPNRRKAARCLRAYLEARAEFAHGRGQARLEALTLARAAWDQYEVHKRNSLVEPGSFGWVSVPV